MSTQWHNVVIIGITVSISQLGLIVWIKPIENSFPRTKEQTSYQCTSFKNKNISYGHIS